MKECVNCKVFILDDTSICPLCHQVLKNDPACCRPMESSYPDLRKKNNASRLIRNIFCFLSILAETVLLVVSYLSGRNLTWGLIVGLILLYINIILRLTILGKSGYLFKILSGIAFSVAALYGIDRITGYRGWSMEIIYPAGCLTMTLAVLILMIVNHRSWQSYLMVLICNILLCLVPVLLLAAGKIHYGLLAEIALAGAFFVFLGTLIIGDYRARTELKRRFHI